MEIEKLVVRLVEKEKELADRKAKYKYANVEALQEEIRSLKKKIKKCTSITEQNFQTNDREERFNKDLDRKQTNITGLQQMSSAQNSSSINNSSISIGERLGPSDNVWDLIVNEKKKGNYALCLDLYKQMFTKYQYDEIGCNAYSGLAKIYFLLGQYENAKLCYMAAINEFCDSIDREFIRMSSDKNYPNIIVNMPMYLFSIYTNKNEMRPIDFNNERLEIKKSAYEYCMNKKLQSFSYSYLFSEKIQAAAGLRGIIYTTLRHFGLLLLIEDNYYQAVSIAEEYKNNYANFTNSFTLNNNLFKRCVSKALDYYHIKKRTEWIDEVYRLLNIKIDNLKEA